MNGQRSILPHFDVFTAPSVVVPPGAITEASAGMGIGNLSRVFALSPVVAAMKGLGDDAPVVDSGAGPAAVAAVTAAGVVWTVAILGITGALSYQAGKAIAPSRQDASTWGWIGVPVGLFTGAWGLGVMGIIANRRKG